MHVKRELKKHDVIKGKKRVQKVKKDLKHELEQRKINTQGKTIKELQEIARLHNVPIDMEINDVQEGWIGRPKGIQQILWETGLLVPRITYVAKIKNADDEDESATKREYSEVLADCHDF